MVVRLLNRAEEGIIAFLLVTMILLVFAEVVFRFVFNMGFLWIGELTLHVSAWMVLFGASWGVKVGAHIGVDAVVKLMTPGVRRVAGLIAVALSLVYCGLLMVGAWVYLDKLLKIGIELEDLPVPKWMAHSILLWGFGLLALRLLELGWRILQGTSSGFEHADEAKEALREVGKEQVASEAEVPR